jgi:AcrR family transcriptional regulator
MSNRTPERRRRYVQTRRAEQSSETGRRIVEAALSLHEEVGPANTSISAVAKRAGVERPTVYRHFPDERSLLAACRGHHMALHPPPTSEAWMHIDEPSERLRVALAELYAYYDENERMTANLVRDATISPTVAEATAMMREALAGMTTRLSAGWSEDRNVNRRVRAGIGHALSFETWRSLCRREGLQPSVAVELMLGMIRSGVR